MSEKEGATTDKAMSITTNMAYHVRDTRIKHTFIHIRCCRRSENETN